ncbi:pyridoxal phosphate-dependent aminotransferase [Clostridium thermarum]|uniref:pyridoxal phosphate-dependent aminotransferase n=1 Tax=Clostridium thermarum TaxID=1716543 RepID=UPI0013D3232F|nr:pyridoxal phosphate-dependent aminotransferase [Clostridium thermarum]
MKFSNLSLQLESSVTLEITAKAKKMRDEGLDVVSFGAGEPDFNTPDNIIEAAIKAMKKGLTKYTPASGIVQLKEAISKKLYNDNGLQYSTSQIIVSTGAKQCLSNLFQAIINPGDEVIVPSPYWISYPELIKLYGGKPVFVSVAEKCDFKYGIEDLERVVTENTKAILVNSPNNPTGAVYGKEELEQIAKFAEKYDLLIISDEIYEKLIYDNEKHVSIASLSKDAYHRTIIVNGLSKTYSMTGWRVGYAAGPEKLIKIMSNIQSHTTSNPTTICQYAALEALEGPQDKIQYMIKQFEIRRNYMVDKINSINHISCINPQGAFYVMVNISKLLNRKMDDVLIKDSVTLSQLLLEKQLVAVIPGEAFGVDNYIRLSYATSLENIEKGLARIEKFICDLT